MSHREALDTVLDHLDAGSGTVAVGNGGAEVDVTDVDRLGVSVTGVRVRRKGPVDVAREAERLAGGLRCLPERLTPTEVAPSLGGAVLRTRPDELDHRDDGLEFFELNVSSGGETDLKRVRVAPDGERSSGRWTMTRDGLGRLLDDLDPTP